MLRKDPNTVYWFHTTLDSCPLIKPLIHKTQLLARLLESAKFPEICIIIVV